MEEHGLRKCNGGLRVMSINRITFLPVGDAALRRCTLSLCTLWHRLEHLPLAATCTAALDVSWPLAVHEHLSRPR